MLRKVRPINFNLVLVFFTLVSSTRAFSTDFSEFTTPPMTQCGDSQLKTACFGEKSSVSLAYVGGREFTGILGSEEVFTECRIKKVTYNLNTDKTSIELHPPSVPHIWWTITVTDEATQTNETSTLPINITCTVTTQLTVLSFTNTIDLHLEMCTAPRPQDHHVTHFIQKQTIKKGHRMNNLLFFDDGVGLHHNYEPSINNTEISGFLQPNCSYHVDGRSGRNKTIIHCFLIARQSKTLKRPLTFLLGLRNTNSDCSDGNYTGYINVSVSVEAKRFKRSTIFNDSHIFRSAAHYARVTQPSEKLKKAKNFVLNVIKSAINPFNITSEGIVYVVDTDALAKVPEHLRLNITWIKDQDIRYEEVDVRVVTEPTPTCSEFKEKYEWMTCASFKKARQCNNSTACGIGTGGSTNYNLRKGTFTDEYPISPKRCMWVGDAHPSNLVTTHLYSTCSSDNKYCPDGICDSLEILSERRLCPQDCQTKISFPAKLNQKTGRGIDVCNGIVYCDDGGCTCVLDENKPKKFNRILAPQPQSIVEDKLVSDSKNHQKKPVCDTGCILITTGGTALVLFAVALSVFLYRLRMRKIFKDKYVDGLPSSEQPFSEYTERNGNSEPLVLNFNMNLTNSFQNATRTTKVDPKWKFPRRRIITEKVLGEGEFGIVYKAQAYGIAGRSGYTTVAVKTLKNDARKQDFYDLFSEYQLLKGVNHPHVIKLLGVCPVDNKCHIGDSEKGPFLLIIEYAAYGSLRNYLRRSRHVLAANEPGQGSNGLDYNVTPREIMSFARQIASGMSYLSDIKLVHRDLAARNILVDENKVCKVSDFGLTRDIYEDNAYFKKSKGRVPVKWMAPESLADHVYTTKSDVWSFGILIWELVTLGASPYPGIEVQNLYSLLKQGYRMERPVNCTSVLYSLMSNCWNLNPDQRPSFHELYQRFDNLLADNTDYLNLTIYNAVGNKSYFNTEPDSGCCDTPQDEKENNLYTNRCPKEDKWTDLVENYHPGYVTPVKVPKPVRGEPGEYTDMSARPQNVQC